MSSFLLISTWLLILSIISSSIFFIESASWLSLKISFYSWALLSMASMGRLGCLLSPWLYICYLKFLYISLRAPIFLPCYLLTFSMYCLICPSTISYLSEIYLWSETRPVLMFLFTIDSSCWYWFEIYLISSSSLGFNFSCSILILSLMNLNTGYLPDFIGKYKFL